jgi:hypothetical protein
MIANGSAGFLICVYLLLLAYLFLLSEDPTQNIAQVLTAGLLSLQRIVQPTGDGSSYVGHENWLRRRTLDLC